MPISKTDPIEQFPVWSTDEEEPKVTRFASIPTPTILKSKSLFGISLTSSLTGQTVTDAALQGWINEAISQLEHLLGLYITPVTFTEKHDYIGALWRNSFAFVKLNQSNVISVSRVAISFSNSMTDAGIIDFPLEYVHLQPQDATIQLVPAFGTSVSGFLLSSFSGANYYAMQAAVGSSIPGAIRVTYTAGFPEDKVPALIAGLIEKMAGLNVLSALGPLLFPYSSVSINLDGLGQSTGNPGPAFLQNRVNDLKEQIEKEIDAAKAYYEKRWNIDYF